MREAKALKSVKDFIRDELDRRNWSERELSKAADVHPTTINEFLNDPKKDLRISTLESIASALGFSAAFLIMSPGERKLWQGELAKNQMDRVKALLDLAEREALKLPGAVPNPKKKNAG